MSVKHALVGPDVIVFDVRQVLLLEAAVGGGRAAVDVLVAHSGGFNGLEGGVYWAFAIEKVFGTYFCNFINIFGARR